MENEKVGGDQADRKNANSLAKRRASLPSMWRLNRIKERDAAGRRMERLDKRRGKPGYKNQNWTEGT